MELNENMLKGKWKDFKGEVQKTWGKITGDELEQARGNLKSIEGLIQQRYAHSKEDITKQLHGIFSKYSDEPKDSVVGATERVKQGLRDGKRH